MSNVLQFSGAVGVSSYLLPLLSENKIFTVVSIFKKGFNIQPIKAEFQQRLIYVSLYDRPFFSVLNYALKDAMIFQQMQAMLKIGDKIVMTADKMVIYSRQQAIVLTIQQCEVIDTSFSQICLTKQDIQFLVANVSAEKYVLQSGFVKISLASLLSKWRIFSSEKINKGVYRNLMRQLIGRGNGLTPSGDDFLQGFLLAAKISGAEVKRFEEELLEWLNLSVTTQVSLAYYDALFQSYTSSTWLILIQAMQTNNLELLQSAIDRILAIGHTSGHDMLLGFLTYFERKMEMNE